MYKEFKNILKDNLELSLKETLNKSIKPFVTELMMYKVFNIEIWLTHDLKLTVVSYDPNYKVWRDLFHKEHINSNNQVLKDNRILNNLDKELRKFCLKYKKELFYSSNKIIIDLLEI